MGTTRIRGVGAMGKTQTTRTRARRQSEPAHFTAVVSRDNVRLLASFAQDYPCMFLRIAWPVHSGARPIAATVQLRGARRRNIQSGRFGIFFSRCIHIIQVVSFSGFLGIGCHAPSDFSPWVLSTRLNRSHRGSAPFTASSSEVFLFFSGFLEIGNHTR